MWTWSLPAKPALYLCLTPLTMPAVKPHLPPSPHVEKAQVCAPGTLASRALLLALGTTRKPSGHSFPDVRATTLCQHSCFLCVDSRECTGSSTSQGPASSWSSLSTEKHGTKHRQFHRALHTLKWLTPPTDFCFLGSFVYFVLFFWEQSPHSPNVLK